MAGGICGGLAGGAVALTAALCGWGLPGLLPGLFLITTVAGFIMPNATAMSMDRHVDLAGSASGLLGVLQFAVGAVVPPLVSSRGVTAVMMTLTILASFACALAAFTAATAGQPASAEKH
jgi:DHA1 family bicyclomycin/chloramphenicol resistance-like MFS transporter